MWTLSRGWGGPCSLPLHPTHCSASLGYSRPGPLTKESQYCPSPYSSCLLESSGGSEHCPLAQDPLHSPTATSCSLPLWSLHIQVPSFPSWCCICRVYPRTVFATLPVGWLWPWEFPALPCGGCRAGGSPALLVGQTLTVCSRQLFLHAKDGGPIMNALAGELSLSVSAWLMHERIQIFVNIYFCMCSAHGAESLKPVQNNYLISEVLDSSP